MRFVKVLREGMVHLQLTGWDMWKMPSRFTDKMDLHCSDVIR